MSIFIPLFLTNHQQSGHVLIFCIQCIFPIAPPHLWMAVCLTCFLRWSIPFTEPAAKAFLRCVTITFLISLVLLEFSLVLCLSFCLPSSLTFSLSLFCFLSPSCSLKPDQLALDGFLLAPVRPDFTLSSLGLSAGRELGDRSLKGRIPDGRWHAGHACMWQGLAQGSGGPAAAVTHQYWGC